jgi:hypothetical protein
MDPHVDRVAAPRPAPPPYHDGPLVLPQTNTPQTVFVSLVITPQGRAAGFSLTEHGDRYIAGLAWPVPPTDPEYALFVTLHLLDDITEVSCAALWYSVPFGPSPGQLRQIMCIRTGKAGYAFDVTPANEHPIDPEIVITPV